MKVWVIMGNDFPVSVWATKEEADAEEGVLRVADMERVRRQSPRGVGIYYRSMEFELEGAKPHWRSLPDDEQQWLITCETQCIHEDPGSYAEVACDDNYATKEECDNALIDYRDERENAVPPDPIR
jgi:hypothetical protein